MWVHLIDFHMVGRDVIVDIEPTLEPPLLILLMGPETPKTGFHSIVEKTVSLCEIYNIDSYHVSEIIRILHLKVEPLQVA